MAHFGTKRHLIGGLRDVTPQQGRYGGHPSDRAGAVRGTSLRQGRGSTGGIPPTVGEQGRKHHPSPQQASVFTEAALQQQIVMWYRNTHCLAHHHPRCLIMSIPNERKPNLIRTGLYAGGADLLIIHLTTAQIPAKGTKGDATAHFDEGISMRVIFVEVKTPEGVISPKQRKFEKHIKSMNGKVEYYVIRSLEQFKKIIISYAH